MTKLINALHEPRVVLYPFYLAWSFFQIFQLHAMAWWHGGKCRIGQAVRIKHPSVFQGRGKLIISNHVTLGYRLAGGINAPILLQPREVESLITIGERTAIMNGCEIIARASIMIGVDCRIGPHTLIYDSDFHDVAPNRRNEIGKTSPVVIGDNVWVGSRTIILKGVSIGGDAVIAAGCIVVKDVPAGSIMAGNPARQVGSVYTIKE